MVKPLSAGNATPAEMWKPHHLRFNFGTMKIESPSQICRSGKNRTRKTKSKGKLFDKQDKHREQSQSMRISDRKEPRTQPRAKGREDRKQKKDCSKGNLNLPVEDERSNTERRQVDKAMARRSPASSRFPEQATGSDRRSRGGLLPSLRMERSDQIFIRAEGVNIVICDCWKD